MFKVQNRNWVFIVSLPFEKPRNEVGALIRFRYHASKPCKFLPDNVRVSTPSAAFWSHFFIDPVENFPLGGS